MTGFSIELRADDLLKRLNPDLIDQKVNQGLTQAALHLERQVKMKLARHTVTGKTRASVGTSISGRIARIGSNNLPLLFLEKGTKAHEIRPRVKKALMWPTGGQSAAGLGRGRQGTLKGRGSFAFAKVVHHPGTQAHHYLENTLREEQGAIRRIFVDILAQAFP